MSKREERDRRKAERLAEQEREAEGQRRRQLLGYIVAGVLGLAVVVGVVVIVASGGGSDSAVSNACAEAHIELQAGSDNGVKPDCRDGTSPPPVQQADLKQAAAAAHCDLRLDLPDEGNSHISPSDPVPNYRTNPPTSGNHIQFPLQQADGAYDEMPGPQYFVHSLEHGRIEIQYSPDLPEKHQLALKGVFDQAPGGMLLFPNNDMPYEVATTAWTQLMGCPKYEGAPTLDAIRDFRDIYIGNGPEGQFPINF